MQEIEKIIRDYLPHVVHMSIATTSDEKPWISEVHYSYDEKLCFYFLSRPSRRHSAELAENDRIAGNIVKQHTVGEKVQGVSFEGACEMLIDVSETDSAYMTYKDRFGIDTERLEEQKEEDGHKFYKVTVEKFYIFDELTMDPAGKHELNWKK